MIPNTPIYSGYARVDITPDYAVHLSGYGDDEIRRSEGIRDNIYITCIAVTSGDETILMYTADLLSFNADAANELRKAVFDAVGVEGDHIFVGAVRMHQILPCIIVNINIIYSDIIRIHKIHFSGSHILTTFHKNKGFKIIYGRKQ